MKNVSVSELAEECGIAPQTLNRWLRDNNLRPELEKRGRTYYVPDDVCYQAKVRFGKVQNSERSSDSTEPQSSANQEEEPDTTDRLITLLESQLAEKDKQIEQQSKQIEALTDSVRQLTESNKALSANATIHSIADKRSELLIAQPSYEVPEKEKEGPKLSRWQRLVRAWKG